MKELSIEEKAQRYDEAIEKGKQIQNTPYTAHWDVMKEVTEYLLPELAESEDEKIRKRIIHALHGDVLDMEEIAKATAWLEKQAEQKPTDKVEPKFKVGDIVKHKDNPHLTYILKRFTDDGDYEFHAIGKDGNEGGTCFAVVKYQDDWELVERKPADSYCQENCKGFQETGKCFADGGCKAKKEAEQKPVDVRTTGYWHVEDIEQKPNWSEEDEKWIDRACMLLDELNHLSTLTLAKIPSNVNDIISHLKSLKDRVQPQSQSQLAWSEEDEAMYQGVIETEQYMLDVVYGRKIFDVGNEGIMGECAKELNWLKSIRPQKWKPSDEQITALRWVLNNIPYNKHKEEISGLLDQIKEL